MFYFIVLFIMQIKKVKNFNWGNTVIRVYAGLNICTHIKKSITYVNRHVHIQSHTQNKQGNPFIEPLRSPQIKTYVFCAVEKIQNEGSEFYAIVPKVTKYIQRTSCSVFRMATNLLLLSGIKPLRKIQILHTPATRSPNKVKIF